MKKRIISLSLGLLFMFNSVGLLAVVSSKLVTARTQKVARRKNDYMISVSGKELAAMVKKLKTQAVQLKMAGEQLKTVYTFIQNNGLGDNFYIYQLSLLPKDEKLAQIKKRVDAGTKPKDVQILRYRIGLIPFSEIEPVLSTLPIGQLRPVLNCAVNNKEINVAKAQELGKKWDWSNKSSVEKINHYGKQAIRYGTIGLPAAAITLGLCCPPAGVVVAAGSVATYIPLMKALGVLTLRALTGF